MNEHDDEILWLKRTLKSTYYTYLVNYIVLRTLHYRPQPIRGKELLGQLNENDH